MHEVTIGCSALSFEPPDVVRCVLRGDISADEMRRMIEHIRASTEGLERLLVLVDVTGLGAIPPDARKEVRGSFGIPYAALAVCGATFQTKILSTMLWSARNLLSGARLPLAFFDTEAEALRWLDAQRAALEPPARRRSARPPRA